MGRTIKIYIPMVPKGTAQQKGMCVVPGRDGGKPRIRHFKKKAITETTNVVQTALLSFQPESPLEGPLSVTWTFVFPWTESQRGTKAKLAECDRVGADWKITRPDTDNLVKGIKDLLEPMMFLRDDAQIADEHVRKMHGNKPGIWIVITEMEFRRAGVKG